MMPSPQRTNAFSSGECEVRANWPRLTLRETAVLQGIATGDCNLEIGVRLGIGKETVKKHVAVLIQKFHVRNRIQLAVRVAVEMPALILGVTKNVVG